MITLGLLLGCPFQQTWHRPALLKVHLNFGLEFAFLGGQERSSGGNFELEKSVNWDLIFVANEGLLGVDFSLFGFLRPWEAKQSSFAHVRYELDSRASVIS